MEFYCTPKYVYPYELKNITSSSKLCQKLLSSISRRFPITVTSCEIAHSSSGSTIVVKASSSYINPAFRWKKGRSIRYTKSNKTKLSIASTYHKEISHQKVPHASWCLWPSQKYNSRSSNLRTRENAWKKKASDKREKYLWNMTRLILVVIPLCLLARLSSKDLSGETSNAKNSYSGRRCTAPIG